ncbi:uroporphyrinogen-III synthase [Massilia pseudoviolaceinigra]|uniref:uroporphyrinogen-III synthase n=1 Tax=Massilia pseudoviolaceinigra TaxID=3057165 RepID=UPI0027968565|nr:uroporphyrinogen-III synthase [Massilia sp. CCM 9206]MDQ1920931.1 uroporphyrinogen-III synthase [Massilia sp. CCM 9206]
MPDAVIITRPLAQAGALAEQVRSLGREAVLLPLLEISALEDQGPLKAALAGMHDCAMVAFVSPNAIDAAFAHIGVWPAWVTLAVLGEGSRAALERHGINNHTATIVSPRDPARSDSENLLETLDLAALAGQKVLIVRGESGRELMADGLRAAGVLVTTVAAYRRNVPALTPALAQQLRALMEGANDWILTSSEALRALVALVQEMGDPALVEKMQQQHLIVPHARIAETASSLGLRHLTLCGSGDERLLAALQSRA